MKRLFVAIHIVPTEEFLDAFQVIKDQMAEERIKWVEVENLHVTLKFIGEVPDELTGTIIKQLNTVSYVSEINFTIEGVGLIKNINDPRAIYASLKNTAGLENLYHEIETRLTAVGVVAASNNFHPHLTLGRIKLLHDKHTMKEILSDFENCYFQQVSCHEFILFESILSQRGPVYKKLSVYPV